ncbi:ABC transporter ATP-binding protein [soil metagenome]
MKTPVSSKQRENEFHRKPADSNNRDAQAAGLSGSNGQHDSKNPPRPDKAARRKYLRQYINWLWPFKRRIATNFVLALFVVGLDSLWPLGLKMMIDLISGSRSDSKIDAMLPHLTLKQIGIAIIVLLVFKQSFDSLRSYLIFALNSHLIQRLRNRLFGHLMHLPLNDLGEMKSGGIISRLSGDVDSVGGLVQMALISPGVAIIRVVGTVTVLLILSWRLAVAALIALPILAFTSYLWSKRVRPVYRSIREDRSQVDGRVGETFGGIRVVRAFRREKREQKGYAVGHQTVIRKQLFAWKNELMLEAVWGLIIPITPLLLVWYGSTLIEQNRASLGSIFAFQIYAMLLLQPIWAIVNSVSQTQKTLAAMERIFGVLAMPEDKPDVPGAIEAPSAVESLRFEHVEFEYRAGKPIISDFEIAVKGGMTVALVGPSGAGKTTITDLVSRFHDPIRGAILLNGIDLRQIKLRSYRRMLAVVQQETFLFDGTVSENIAYGLRDAGQNAIQDAARRANAHQFIEQLPEGYETLIGERGFKLSGGQRQRISIARAILADPRILVLDEATSNLDTESEQLIQASLSELYKNRTTFVIAHRLSTVTHADLIIAIDAGRIVETGTHDELMDHRGFYFEMVERQRRSMGTLAEA